MKCRCLYEIVSGSGGDLEKAIDSTGGIRGECQGFIGLRRFSIGFGGLEILKMHQ